MSDLSAAVCVQRLPLWILSNFRLIEEADLIGVKSVGHSHGNVSWLMAKEICHGEGTGKNRHVPEKTIIVKRDR